MDRLMGVALSAGLGMQALLYAAMFVTSVVHVNVSLDIMGAVGKQYQLLNETSTCVYAWSARPSRNVANASSVCARHWTLKGDMQTRADCYVDTLVVDTVQGRVEKPARADEIFVDRCRCDARERKRPRRHRVTHFPVEHVSRSENITTIAGCSGCYPVVALNDAAALDLHMPWSQWSEPFDDTRNKTVRVRVRLETEQLAGLERHALSWRPGDEKRIDEWLVQFDLL